MNSNITHVHAFVYVAYVKCEFHHVCECVSSGTFVFRLHDYIAAMWLANGFGVRVGERATRQPPALHSVDKFNAENYL